MALTLRTDDELERALTELSTAFGASRQEVIRRAVLSLRERTAHRARVEGATLELIRDWRDLLERLASA
ncbi:MAG: CopG family transcriptional regulator [Acidimicrobiales bacterium]